MRPQPRYKPGDKIGGRYQVHQVKMGGMGEVYLCLDLVQMHPYALKTFQQRYLIQSQELRAAFEQEVATWVALEKHPNIVRCFFMEYFDNQPFVVLEWIAGEEGKGANLRDWLLHGPLELNIALNFTIDICRGLIHAQEKQSGLVHRDLKPENVLVAQEGVAKITDFGLAQIVERAELVINNEVLSERADRYSLSGQWGSIVGTPAYMAPEQWRGEPLDERTDIYAIGCILYELLTGEWPIRVEFAPSEPQQVQQWLAAMKLMHERGSIAPLPPELPAEVSKLLQSCLTKTKVERPASLAELLDGLDRLYRQLFDVPPKPLPEIGRFTATDYNNRGVTYNNLKQYEQALPDLNRAIELDPTDAMAYSNRGIANHALQHYETAVADFSWAIKLDPNYAKAYSNRGIAYHTLRQYDQALADYDRVIELDPTFAPAYSNRGVTYNNLKQYEQALADYNRAIELEPDYAIAYSNRGNTYERLQQYEQALADQNRAIELDPNYAPAYSNRGNTYERLQQYEQALADQNRAIELDPNLAQAYSNRGITYYDLKQYEQALADQNRAIELDPNLTQAYSHRGLTYTDLQQYKAALADYDRAIELDPNYALSYVNLGVLLGNQGMHKEALPYFEKAAQLGLPEGAQYAAMARQILRADPSSRVTAQHAFEAFQQASSAEVMQQAVDRFPFMTQADFIAAIEQAIAQQVPPTQRPYFEQRLAWLRQISREE